MKSQAIQTEPATIKQTLPAAPGDGLKSQGHPLRELKASTRKAFGLFRKPLWLMKNGP